MPSYYNVQVGPSKSDEPLSREELIARIIDMKASKDTPVEILEALKFLDRAKTREEARNRILQQLADDDGDKGWLESAMYLIEKEENQGKDVNDKGYIGYNTGRLPPSESDKQRPIDPEDLPISSIHDYEDKFFSQYLKNNDVSNDGRDARSRLYENLATGVPIRKQILNRLKRTAGLKASYDKLGNVKFEVDEDAVTENKDGTEASRFKNFKEAMGFHEYESPQDVGDFMLRVLLRGKEAHKWSTEDKSLTDAIPLIAAEFVAPQVMETLQDGKKPTKADVAADAVLAGLAAVPGSAMAKAGYMPLIRGVRPARLAKNTSLLDNAGTALKREASLAGKSALGAAAITGMQEGVDYAHDVADEIFGPEIRYSYTYSNPVGEQRPEESQHEEEFGKRHKNPFKANLHPVDRASSVAASLMYGGLSTPIVRQLPWLRYRRRSSIEQPSLERHLEEADAFREKMRKEEEVNFKKGNSPLKWRKLQNEYEDLTSRLAESLNESKRKFNGRGRDELRYTTKYEDVPTKNGKFKRVKKRELVDEDKPLKKLLDKIDKQWDEIADFEDKYGRNMDSWPVRKLINFIQWAKQKEGTKLGKSVNKGGKALKDYLKNYARMQALNKATNTSIPKLKEALLKWEAESEEEDE